MKKLFLLLCLIFGPGFLAVTITGCEEETEYFELTAQQSQGHVFNFQPAPQLLIRVNYQSRRYVSLVDKEPDFGISKAHAFSPGPPRLRFKIVAFKITTDHGYGPDYPAGSDVTSQFQPDVSFPVETLNNFEVTLFSTKATPSHFETSFTVTTIFEHGVKLTSSTEKVSL